MQTRDFIGLLKPIYHYRFAWLPKRGAAVHQLGSNGRTFCGVESHGGHLERGDTAPTWAGLPCQNCAQYVRGV